MNEIVISGVKPYDGRYPFELDTFTTREWGWIKRMAGYLPLTFEINALADPEMLCVLAVILMRRAGRIDTREVPDVFERLQDVPPESTIRLEFDEEPAEDGDADSPPPTSSNGSNGSSGDSGKTSSETSPPTPPASGMPAWASLASPPATPSET